MRDFENLGAYLPATVLKQLMEGQFQVPQAQKFQTVCLFADVSGFTVLSEKLCAEGQDGIEELAAQLNKYMAQVVKLTSRAGGDVLKFAGDALISIFTPEDGKDLSNAIIRAVQCSLDMQQRLTNFSFSFRRTDVDGLDVPGAKLVEGELNIKLGIGIGDVSILYVGGESDNVMPERYEYVAMGPALTEAFAAESAAVRGQVVISQSAYDLVSKRITCEPIPAPLAAAAHFLVKSVKEGETLTWRRKDELTSFAPSDEVESTIWRCVPAAVLPYLNESNEFWAPELRRVTTLFVNLGYTEEDMAKVDLEGLHTTYRAMQQCVFQFEGTINKFLCDDKGSTILVVFGLPPFAHENDATRGVLSAMSILSKLKELGREGSVGITTGEAFCGVVGTRGNRREYSVIGDVVNVSARLMSESKKQRCGHLMDDNTQRAIKAGGFRTIYFSSVLLKGKAAETHVYQVSGKQENDSVQSKPSSATVGGRAAASSGAGVVLAAKRTLKKADSVKKKAGRPSFGVAAAHLGEEASEADKLAAADPSSIRLQVSAITEARHLKLVRDAALQRKLARDVARQTLKKDNSSTLSKALVSFANASVKGLKMGTGRAKNADEAKSGPSPPPVTILPTRVLKAARITFNSCSTGGTGAGGNASLSTTFTLPLENHINTVYDLKDAALTRLGNRELLAKGPQAERAYFSFRWNEPGKEREDIQDESLLLDNLLETPWPMIELILVEHESKRAAEQSTTPVHRGRRAPAYSVTTMKRMSTRDRLELSKQRLLVHAEGSIVILEGMQGVGKTYLVENIFLSDDFIAQTLTGVAMGNPYETEILSSTLNVWTILLKQLLEQALHLLDKKADAFDAQFETIKTAILQVNPKFDNFTALHELCSCALETGHLCEKLLRNLSNDGDTAAIDMIAQLIAGLSLAHLPVMLVIDDSHFLDVSSWQLVTVMAQLIEDCKARVLLLLLHRNIIDAEKFVPTNETVEGYNNMRALENKFTKNRRQAAQFYQDVLTRKCVDFVEKRADAEDVSDIVKERLNIDKLDNLDALLEFLVEKTQGNRLFIVSFLEDLMAANLIHFLPDKSSCTLPNEFRERLRARTLPLPSVVEGIGATLLDSMSISQQMALKVAAIIGEKFTLELVTQLFPIAHLKTTLEEEWKTLVRLGVVVEDSSHAVAENLSSSVPVPEEAEEGGRKKRPVIAKRYVFSNPWMLETLRKRMLLKQRRKLNEIYKILMEERARENNKEFMERAGALLTIYHAGYLTVKKDQAKNVLKLWKRRWVVLENDELVQYYEENNMARKLEVIKLSAPGTTVTNIVSSSVATNLIGGFVVTNKIGGQTGEGGGGGGGGNLGGVESGDQGKHFPFCFVVHAREWYKKDVLQAKPRDFYMAPDSLKEQQDWVFKIGVQIDTHKMKQQADVKPRSFSGNNA